jgi:hypothetical protein
VYVFDVLAGDWPAGVDVREPRMIRKAAGKRPAPEGPSQKRKSMNPLGTGGPLIIDDEDSSRKQCRVMASLTDDEEDEYEVPLARWQREQGAARMPMSPRAPTSSRAVMPPRAPTLPRAATPPRALTPPRAATPSQTDIPSMGCAGSAVPEGVQARR